MSMILYGAVQLLDSTIERRESVISFWRSLERAHGASIIVDAPSSNYLEPEIANLWNTPEWLRFLVVSGGSGQHGASDAFLLHAAELGHVIMGMHTRIEPAKIWPRIPPLRLLAFMFRHEMIADAYLVIEHTSGDIATMDDLRHLPVTTVLTEIWNKYCLDMSSEKPSLYHVNLALLPE